MTYLAEVIADTARSPSRCWAAVVVVHDRRNSQSESTRWSVVLLVSEEEREALLALRSAVLEADGVMEVILQCGRETTTTHLIAYLMIKACRRRCSGAAPSAVTDCRRGEEVNAFFSFQFEKLDSELWNLSRIRR